MKTEMVKCPYCEQMTVKAYYTENIQDLEWRELPCTNQYCETNDRYSQPQYSDVTPDYDDHSDADSGL